MADQESVVLVVCGDAAAARFMTRCLSHPRIALQCVTDDLAVNDALAQRRFALVVSASGTGRRGPLVICEIARAYQADVPVLVTCGSETDPERLRDHSGRHLPGVEYLDLRDVTVPLVQGTRVRAAALALLRLEEDAAAAQGWLQSQALAEKPANEHEVRESHETSPRSEAQPRTQAEGIERDDQDELGPEDREAEAVAFEQQEVGEEDLEFAERLVKRLRRIDFRTPAPKEARGEGADAVTSRLRERLRQLERDAAHLAFVFADRAALLASADERRNAVQTRLDEATVELARLRQEIQQKEQSFAALLEQAQDAFALLREHAIETEAEAATRVQELVERHQAQVAELQQRHAAETKGLEAKAAADEANWQTRVGRIKEDVLGLRHANEELAATLAQRDQEAASTRAALAAREEQVTELKGLLEARDAASLKAQAEAQQRDEHYGQKLELLEQGLQHLSGSVQELPRLAQLAEPVQTCATAVQGLATELHAAIEAESGKLAEAERDRAASLTGKLGAVEGQAQALGERMSALTAQLGSARTEEVAALANLVKEGHERLAQLSRDMDRAIKETRSTTPEAVIEARLVALEELGRLTADQLDRLRSLESTTQERAEAHQRVAERLAESADRLERGAAAATAVAATTVAASAGAPPPVSPNSTLSWRLLAWRVAPAAACLLIGLCLGLLLSPRTPGPSGVSSEAEGKAVRLHEPAVTAGARAAVDKPKAAETKAIAAAPSAGPAAAAAPKQPEAAVVAPASSPAADSPRSAGSEAAPERKVLRGAMFQAARNKDWKETAALGKKMQASFELDWEASLLLAEALGRAGDADAGIVKYQEFIRNFADNKYIEDAWYRMAVLMTEQKRNKEARSVFERLTKSAANHMRTKAEQALQALAP
jgi:hypothetical protein